MVLVAGVDSSTQSVKVVVCDADTGAIVREARGSHPDGTEVDPRRWWEELSRVLGGEGSEGFLTGVSAMSIAGQQLGMVALDADGIPVRNALLWNDTRAAPDAADLIFELGGPEAWAAAVGSVPPAGFTVSKVRWLARVEPENAARVHRLMHPHDYLTWRLAGCPDDVVTDRGDASGSGYWSPAQSCYRMDIFTRALGRAAELPRVAGPAERIGTARGTDIALGPGTGDNMAAGLALDLRPGDVVVSLGTSGTAYAVSEHPTADASGRVVGLADARGRFLPLVCTLNAARVLTATAALLGMSLDELGEAALSAAPGSEGLVLLPYLDGERTPALPFATGSLHGIRRDNLTPANVARAAIEGMLCGLADAVDALSEVGVTIRRVLLIGGAAVNPAVPSIAATLMPASVVVPPAFEFVAIGAARQAAWVHRGGADPPVWSGYQGRDVHATLVPAVRENYASVRDRAYPELADPMGKV